MQEIFCFVYSKLDINIVQDVCYHENTQPIDSLLKFYCNTHVHYKTLVRISISSQSFTFSLLF